MEKEKEIYITMLIESLRTKNTVLDEIISINVKEAEMLKSETLNLELFDSSIDEKEKQLEKLGNLDDGFETVYNRIRSEVITNKDMYHEQIALMQRQIRSIMDKNITIQAQEVRIKAAVSGHSNKMHAEFNKKRKATKAVENYYHSMNRMNAVDPQFMDKKN
jgi:aspartate-semialdehyde dehydrogenase